MLQSFVTTVNFLFIFNVCFMYLGSSILGTYVYIIASILVALIPFSPSFSLATIFVLKSILSDISIATPAFFFYFHLHGVTSAILSISVSVCLVSEVSLS